jgi:hypothetical protein
MLDMRRRIIKNEKALRKTLCLALKNINSVLNLSNYIVVAKVAFAILSRPEKNTSLAK